MEVEPQAFGRIAAQTAKQVIIQRVREAERNSLYNSFKAREGELITAFPQNGRDDKWYMVYQIYPLLYQRRTGGVKRKNPQKREKGRDGYFCCWAERISLIF